MTREEAINQLQHILNWTEHHDEKEIDAYNEEAIGYAIKALKQEPCDVFDEYGNYKYPSDVELTEPNTATSMPCDDAISRQAAIDTIESWLSCDDYNEAERHIMRAMQSVLYDLSSVNLQEPKTGHWIYKQYGGYPEQGNYHCSECDEIDNRTSAHCPNCGCRMIEPQESEK